MLVWSLSPVTQLHVVSHAIDGFHTPINHPTSRGQEHDQEAAVQWTFHLERNSFFYLSALMVRIQCRLTSLYYAHGCAKHRSILTLALQKWSHAPWKTSQGVVVCTDEFLSRNEHRLQDADISSTHGKHIHGNECNLLRACISCIMCHGNNLTATA